MPRRSSSPSAKYALALRRLSLACRNSRTSRFKTLICSRSAVAGPGRRPPSRSAWRTQLRSVLAAPFQHEADRPLAHLRRVARRRPLRRHRSILSRVGASGKPRAVHCAGPAQSQVGFAPSSVPPASVPRALPWLLSGAVSMGQADASEAVRQQPRTGSLSPGVQRSAPTTCTAGLSEQSPPWYDDFIPDLSFPLEDNLGLG